MKKIFLSILLIIVNKLTFAQSWELLISSNSYDATQLNFSNTAYNQNANIFYSVYKIGSTSKIQAFNVNSKTVNTLSTTNIPAIDLNTLTYDNINNRLVSNRAGRENIYAVSASGGAWSQIGTGSGDYESYGAQFFWNSSKKAVCFFGGYGYYYTKNWIWENSGSSWSNTYVNNNLCDNSNPAKRNGQVALGSPGSNKIFIFSGHGSCDGKQTSSSCSLGSPWATDVGMYCWLKDLWQLDLNTYTFTNILPVNSNSISKEGQIVYDYNNNTFYIIGGYIPSATYNSSYGNNTDFETSILRYRVGIDSGFSPFLVGGTPPPSVKLNNLGPNSAFYDATNNQIIWARKDGIWGIKLSNGCNQPISSITPIGSTTFCQGGFVNLNASTGTNYTYEWYNNGQIINGATASTYQATTSGNYTLKVMDGTCSTTSSATTIVVNQYPSSNIQISGNTTICEGSSVTLTAQGNGSYLWSNGATSKTITINKTGSYSVAVTQNGCTANSSNTSITVKPNPTASITPKGNTTFCQGGFVNLNASTGSNYSYQWYNNGQLINGANTSTYQANSSGNYTVKITDGACNTTSSATTVVVNQYTSSNVQVSGNTTICDGSSVTLTAQGNGSYLWSNGATSKSITVKKTGSYSVAVTQNGCTANSSSTSITVNPNPTASITPQGSTTFCQGGFVNLVANGGTSYQWNTGSSNNTFSANQSGTYIVNVFNSFGCQASASQTVTVNTNPTVTFNGLNEYTLKNLIAVQLIGVPTGGTFSGEGMKGTKFLPSNVSLGKKTITYNYTSPQGCSGSATRSTIVVDSVGNVCNITTYDTIRTTITKYDTVKVNKTIYDTILKLKFKLTTGINANQYTSLSLYPNPTTDVLNIEVEDAKAFNGYRYRILDAIGKEVYNELIKATKTEIPLKSLGAAGMYLFEVIDQKNKTIQSKKIVLE
jgi:hypothetical protein